MLDHTGGILLRVLLVLAAMAALSGARAAEDAAPPPHAAGADWPQWRGPRGDGISDETGWHADFGRQGPPVRWQRQIGVGYAAVSVCAGRAYTAGWADGHDTVFALDADSGEVLWTHRYPIHRHNNLHQGGPAATPAADGQRVYSLSRDGDLLCLDADSGQVVWSKSLTTELGAKIPDWAFSGSPVLRDQVLYIDVGLVVALDKTTGSVLWQTADYGAAYSTPLPWSPGDRPLLAAFPNHGLVVLDATTGAELAKHRWETQYGVNAATPIADGQRLFISSGYGRGAALLQLDEAELRVLWENKEMRNQMASSVLIEGSLYGFDEGQLRCLDMATGLVRWSHKGLGKGSLMAAAGRLIVLSDDGELVLADAAPGGFEPRTRAKVLDASNCWTVPVLAHGLIYCRSNDGQLVCVDVRPR